MGQGSQQSCPVFLGPANLILHLVEGTGYLTNILWPLFRNPDFLPTSKSVGGPAQLIHWPQNSTDRQQQGQRKQHGGNPDAGERGL